MKKITILILIFSLLTFICLLVFSIFFLHASSEMFYYAKIDIVTSEINLKYAYRDLAYGLTALIGLILNIIEITLLVLKARKEKKN